MKARVPNGLGKGPANNMNQMLKQAQVMQDKITALQADLEEREFTGTAGGGVVEVKINGKRNVLDLKISPDIVDKDNIDDLQDIIKAAFNAPSTPQPATPTQAINDWDNVPDPL